ncbi:glycosyltransferase [Fictibacillus fluitans]|uniref:Glycosyltransferase n=1 Tax=Fictibacillus fluitans TaxID=3058422 RepID=A0ABT8HQJ4_9BACL|nr:glycosyltransferase [Fictibacillus sp. NE201]MDN4523041.1 glycosyltransferase [Fictibacillus sp. NE201]
MKEKITIFCLLNSLDLQRGGLTKASLMQANTFASLGYKTFILTFNFNQRYNTIIEQMVTMGKIDSRIQILNMYQSLGEFDYSSIVPQPMMEIEKSKANGAILDPHIGQPHSYRVYENGMYTKYFRLDENKRLFFMDHFNEQRYRVKREDYDEYGYARKVSYMDYERNKPRQMVFYNDTGEAFLSKWVNPQNGLAFRVNLFKDGKLKRIFSNDNELKGYWLEQVTSSYENPVIISDARICDSLVINLKSEQAVKIWRLHSNHLDMKGEIASTVATAFDNLQEFDVALALTNQQKKDIEDRFGTKDNLKAIPHAADQFTEYNWFAPVKKENLAVVVTRFAAIKRIDHIILAFKHVVDRVPAARLELWGYGDEEKNLKSLIRSENLTANVKVMGFTQNPAEPYQRSLFSVMASKTEGFPLSIFESMSNGSPIVTYDFKYGPGDLIDNGEDGWIVPNEDIQALAEKMIWMFENKKEAIKMGKKAVKKVKENFNLDLYAKQWDEVIEEAVKKKMAHYIQQ